jgi:Mg2+ and Co2+ transporter CorA
VKWIEVGAQRAIELAGEPPSPPTEGFLWLDVLHDEAIADPEGLREAVRRVSGARLHDLHLQDAANLQHPSYFDSTSEYDMLVFRKLAIGELKPLEEKSGTADRRRMLQEIVTRPITFFLLERLLVTVRQGTSKTTELRDSYLEETPDASLNDAYLVRLNDVLEHIQRVLHHARRLESSAESAVQLHFSATTHQTNETMRKLTAIAAIFAPLTLITGIFGMNFHFMPPLDQPHGFTWTLAGMAGIIVVMLLYFWARRILDRPRTPKPWRWFR